MADVMRPPDADPDCTCPYAYRSDLGRLYGISMGPGWVRLKDASDCIVHAGGITHFAGERSTESAPEEGSDA